MADNTSPSFFAGLDPVPIQIVLTKDRSQESIYDAAGLPPSLFIQTVQPYQLHRPDAATIELSLGPKGFGAELLDALRWLAQVAAVGILHSLPSDDVIAYVHHYLEVNKPEWGYEELTEHGDNFIRDRYHRATTDDNYKQGLASLRQEPKLMIRSTHLQQWLTTRNTHSP